MWDKLRCKDKEEYKRLILAFASLSAMFSQKAEADQDDVIPCPIINSKFQETAFQKAFHAVSEDIGNTSYDASVKLEAPDGTVLKFLVGIKTFGIGSGDQKIAQFKAMHDDWSALLDEIKANASNEDGSSRSADEIHRINQPLYLKLAKEIAILRNERIVSSEANLRGFKVRAGDPAVEAVYHVLMPSKKGDNPKIFVGETAYQKIAIDRIQIIGCTNEKNPTNFCFHDGFHRYKFTAADSQLLMAFQNREIVVDSWDVKYAEDAYALFSQIATHVYGPKVGTANAISTGGAMMAASAKAGYEAPRITESYSWFIPIERYSGFNSFFGVGSKLSLKDRPRVVEQLVHNYCALIDDATLQKEKSLLLSYLTEPASSQAEKRQKEEDRQTIVGIAESTKNPTFLADVRKLVFRPADEMYIPIPNSRVFHESHPDFFAPGAGEFVERSSKLKNPKEKCAFNLVFEPSGDAMRSFITQDNGKAIESYEKQTYLGKWLKNEVFRLKDYEPVTFHKLQEIGLNGMRLYKIAGDPNVHLLFIEIDPHNLPEDFVAPGRN